MKKQKAANGKIEIDVCDNCGGEFLDYKELNVIRTGSETANEEADRMMEKLFVENYLKTTNRKPSEGIKSSPCRGAFESIIRKFFV